MVHDCTSFEVKLLGVMNKYVPLKKEVLCTNHMSYVTKA